MQGKFLAAGICLVLLFAVISCKDDLSSLGFPGDSRLTTKYVELDIPASVLRKSTLITEKIDADQTHRILVGKYSDPELGNIEAKAYLSFIPPISIPTVPGTAVFDSLVLNLRTPFYYYGNLDSTAQTLQVFQVLDTLSDDVSTYYSNSSINVDPTIIGERTFPVDAEDYRTYVKTLQDSDTTNDRIVMFRIKINGAMGSELLNDFVNDPELVKDPSRFNGKYRGFAVGMSAGDKIISFDPSLRNPLIHPRSTAKDSRLTLFYTDTADDTHKTLQFLLDDAFNVSSSLQLKAKSFSVITQDVSGTALDGIVPNVDFTPANGKVYVQGGTALLTKLDFTPFYNYMDTVKNAVFSSAQLIVTNTSSSNPFGTMTLRVLNSLNEFQSPYLDSTQIKRIYFPTFTNSNLLLKRAMDPYFGPNSSGFVVGGVTEPTVDARTDTGSSEIPISFDNGLVSNIFLTEFCQKLYYNRTHPRRVTKLALVADDLDYRKSVSSVSLNNQIKLRLYYSKPVISIR